MQEVKFVIAIQKTLMLLCIPPRVQVTMQTPAMDPWDMPLLCQCPDTGHVCM